ncbi:MAG TPA: lantibiotic dehydratase C-terminal domain-containing protein, partial [Thermoanaerobaculia bacterium]|nr:lantibiotic dehydratase C-terminal domain-containing protein [Thermoanaerobaculia bacterium]
MDDWLSYHLYYHEDLSRAVLGFVYPAVSSLLSAGWIDRFFFVRYGLGGPHVRLRLRPLPGHAPLIDRAVHGSAEVFLSRSPSTARLDPEALQRQTQAMLAGDPHETDATVYPDNTLVAAAFRPEVQRYGGPNLLPVSVDFFTVSSAAAIDFLVRSGAEPRSQQLILALRLLLAQALCFAIDEEELLALLGYGVESWGEAVPT